MTATTIVCIAIAGAGLLIAIISLPLFMRKEKLVKSCTVITEGTVIKYRYGGGDNAHSVAPVVEYEVDGKKYKAYRHYRGVSKKKSRVDTTLNTFSGGTEFYVSEKDVFCIVSRGSIINYNIFKEKYPLGSSLPVLYNPKKPKQGFVEKVVTISDIAGIVLLCVGLGLMVLAGLFYLIF